MSWIAQGFADVINGIASLIDFLNPFSENFFGIKIIEAIGSALEAIFVPDEEVINNLVTSVSSKFAFIDTINNTIESLKGMFSGTAPLPSMTITLPENKWFNGSITLIDLSWYAPFKPYGDLIISAFIYVFFVWRTFVALPSIISGAGGSYKDTMTSIAGIDEFTAGKHGNTYINGRHAR